MTRSGLQSLQVPLSSFTASLTFSAAAAKQVPACKQSWRRQFSSTPSRDATRLRRDMFAWLRSRGKNFLEPVEDNTNYLTDYDSRGFRLPDEANSRAANRQAGEVKGRSTRMRPRNPFPLNERFVSQPILSDELRQEIWRRVTVDKKSIRIVSVELGVEMRRVGAVVRLLEVEKQWRAEVSRQQLLLLPLALSCDEHPKFD
jgi:Eukaryotic mitochondrial regulator protein